MKLSKIISFILLFVLISMTALGQSRTVRKGNKFYKDGEYFRALELYQEARSEGEELAVDIQRKIAHCYYYLNDIDNAYIAFDGLKGQLEPKDLVNYASSAHKIGSYQEAITLYGKAKEYKVGNRSEIDRLIESCVWALQNDEFNMALYVNPSTLLTFGQSFGIQYYKDGVVYSSSSGDGSGKVDRYGKEFLNLYYSELENGEMKNRRLFSENMAFDYHVGAISFTSDEKTMYYTKSVRVRGGESKIKIFSVQYDGENWGNEKVLPINSNEYDCAYPAVTPNDRYLVFASNMSGGFGGTDLYVAERYNDGRFGQPRNLGQEINSYGNERFPFVSENYDLYYSSDGELGFGGLDIFKASKRGDESWGNSKNMMKPFNSNKDDFGYVIDPNDPNQGFLSSNRISSGEDAIFYVEPRQDDDSSSGSGGDEEMVPMGGMLYDEMGVVDTQPAPQADPEPQPEPEVKVEITPEPEPEPDLSAFPDAFTTTVISTFNGTNIENAKVVVRDVASNQIVVDGLTDRNGKIHLILPDVYRNENQTFDINVSKDQDYNARKMIVDIVEIEDIARNGISLTPVFDDVVLDDIGTMIIPYRGENITAE
jgi:tetratricopeptide (TPR) repeat protein